MGAQWQDQQSAELSWQIRDDDDPGSLDRASPARYETQVSEAEHFQNLKSWTTFLHQFGLTKIFSNQDCEIPNLQNTSLGHECSRWATKPRQQKPILQNTGYDSSSWMTKLEMRWSKFTKPVIQRLKLNERSRTVWAKAQNLSCESSRES